MCKCFYFSLCLQICVEPTHNLTGVCVCVGCGQLPCVQRGEVVPDTTGAVLFAAPAWGCIRSEVNGSSLLGISLRSVTPRAFINKAWCVLKPGRAALRGVHEERTHTVNC